MSETNAQPLAALLASHPEECAAVVAALACAGPNGGLDAADARALDIDTLALYRVCGALQSAGIVGKYTQAFCLEDPADALAIARMGAAAWLAQRVGAPASTNPLNIGAIRLCALAAEGARIGAIFVAASATALPFPRDAAEYRERMGRVAELIAGLPMAVLDVDAEVAAGRGAGASAKGDQR